MELVNQRADADWLRGTYAASERRVCGLLTMAVSSYRYRTTRCDDELRTRLVELAREKPRFGYRRLHVLLLRAGEAVNHKRVHRVYREAGLSLRRKKRKHCVRVGQPLVERTAANQEWALDFVHDAVECGRAIRVLSVVDAYTRECPALEVDTSFASRRVTRVLDGIIVVTCPHFPHTDHTTFWSCLVSKIPAAGAVGMWETPEANAEAFSKAVLSPSFP